MIYSYTINILLLTNNVNIRTQICLNNFCRLNKKDWYASTEAGSSLKCCHPRARPQTTMLYIVPNERVGAKANDR